MKYKMFFKIKNLFKRKKIFNKQNKSGTSGLRHK